MSAPDRCGYCNALSPQLLPCRPCRELETARAEVATLTKELEEAREGRAGALKEMAKARAERDAAQKAAELARLSYCNSLNLCERISAERDAARKERDDYQNEYTHQRTLAESRQARCIELEKEGALGWAELAKEKAAHEKTRALLVDDLGREGQDHETIVRLSGELESLRLAYSSRIDECDRLIKERDAARKELEAEKKNHELTSEALGKVNYIASRAGIDRDTYLRERDAARTDLATVAEARDTWQATAHKYRDALGPLTKELAEVSANLTSTQERCTELLEEVRTLKADARARRGTTLCPSCEGILKDPAWFRAEFKGAPWTIHQAKTAGGATVVEVTSTPERRACTGPLYTAEDVAGWLRSLNAKPQYRNGMCESFMWLHGAATGSEANSLAAWKAAQK